MLPASLAGLRAGIHGHADIGLRERGSIVGSIAGHGHEFPFGLLAFDQRHLVFGLGLSEEIIDARFLGDRRRGERIVSGDHHGANAHRAKLIEALFHAAFDDVGQGYRAQHAAVF